MACVTSTESEPNLLQCAIISLQYESQYFGFHPRMFLDIVYNIFFENIITSLTQMKQFMIQKFQDVPPNLIKVQTDLFLKRVLEKLDKSIDKLEVFLSKHVFSIDSHTILPEDEIHVKNPCSKDDDEKIDAEIENLKRKILDEKAKRFALKAKINEQKEVKEMLHSLQSELKTLLEIQDVSPENIDLLFSNLMKLSNFNCVNTSLRK